MNNERAMDDLIKNWSELGKNMDRRNFIQEQVSLPDFH